MLKNVLIISLFLNILFLSTFVVMLHNKGGLSYISKKIGIPAQAKTITTPTPDQQFRIDAIKNFNTLPSLLNDSIIFVGDSHMAGCLWDDAFPGKNIINYGIGGDTTQGIIDRLDTVVERQPKAIFIMAGINDLSLKIPTEQILSNYHTIIKTVKRKSPGTKIYVHSILPPNNQLGFTPIMPYVTADIVKGLNADIEDMCKQNGVEYIDLYSHVTKNDLLVYSHDGVHMTVVGYQKWWKVLERYL